MDRLVEASMRKLEGIYRRAKYDGPAFVANPVYLPMLDAEGRDYTISDRPIAELADSIEENYRRRADFLHTVGDDGVPYARLNTATHLYASSFGCAVHLFGDSNPCALPLVRTAEEADRLRQPDIRNSRMLGRVFEMANEIRRRLGTEAPIGPPDVQTGFDTACLIWNKEDLYMALGDDEGRGAVKRLAARCSAFLSDFLAAYRTEVPGTSPCHCPDVWSPPDLGPWVSNDECGALSPAMAEELCMPELLELARRFGSLGMHCCASAEHQFESWKKIPGLYALNRVPARQGFEPLIEHFGGAADPVHVLFWTEDAGLDRLLEAATPEMRFIVVRGDMEPEAARRWLDEARSKGQGGKAV